MHPSACSLIVRPITTNLSIFCQRDYIYFIRWFQIYHLQTDHQSEQNRYRNQSIWPLARQLYKSPCFLRFDTCLFYWTFEIAVQLFSGLKEIGVIRRRGMVRFIFTLPVIFQFSFFITMSLLILFDIICGTESKRCRFCCMLSLWYVIKMKRRKS